MALVMLGLVLWLGPTTFTATGGGLAAADSCYAPAALNFTSQQGSLWLNGQPIKLKGVSWFGFETNTNVVHGLWSKTWSFILDFLSNNKFNIIRLPFYIGIVKNDPVSVLSDKLGSNSDLVGLSALQIMDKIIDEAAKRGILIMLDLHSFNPDSFSSDGLWYNSDNPEATVIDAWVKILNRYSNKWNVVAADLKNEPFSTTWGTGASGTDWNTAASRIANSIATSVSSRFLIFVEGTAVSPACTDACFYGENLIGVKTNPVVLNHQYKLVYSPHVYGPAVYNQPYFSAGNFPNNMPAIWDAHWGFVAGQTGNAVVIGEWGGTTSGNNGVWLNALASYLQSKGMTDQFWWCLNPNSGDTGGLLLDDWTSPDTAKLNLLASLVPSPSRFSVDTNGKVCLAGTVTVSVTPSKAASSTKSPTPSISRSATPSPSKGASRTLTPATSRSPSASPSRGSSPSRSPVRATPSGKPVDDQVSSSAALQHPFWWVLSV